MSYQVLARKWRPQNFHQLVGQSHVKQALVNALNEQRLHHAYLFTGTRGVGKTTIARIFAKSLNCEQGISAEPCGKCATCLDIEAGRYVDLIEIDAASRTKVEDTREILDNVQYAPTRGQYKVYLIDEVHMLSKHSFNALLKTLEEPPEHVKFLLATTDPQKLPVTILSRCLQFNLSALSVEQISKQLSDILGQEHISFEQQAIELLAKAADGSMRDALSLTDQAIAQTNAALNAQAIKDMLGLMDVRYAQQLLLSALLSDGEGLMEHTQALAKANPNYVAVLDDMLNLCHSIQLTQLVPQAANLSDNDKEFISQAAQEFDAQHIHLLYQLILSGKRDLQYASSAKVGFEMLMLRLLAFEPSAQPSSDQANTAQASASQNAQEKQSKVAALRSLLQKPPKAEQNVPVEPVQPKVEVASETPATPKVPAPEPIQDEAPPQPQASEEELAGQLNSVLDEAADMGYQQSAMPQQSDAAIPEYQPDHEPVQQSEQTPAQDLAQNAAEPQESPAQQLASMENDAQSAIARILKNRGANTAKLDSSAPPKKNEAPAERAFQASADTAIVEQPKSTPKRVKQSAPERIMQRHQNNPHNLAPELLAQINPPTIDQNQNDDAVEVIAAPADFVSAVSDIRLADQKDDWANTISEIGFSGRVRQFVINSVIGKNEDTVTLTVAPKVNALYDDNLHQRIADGLSKHFKQAIQLQVEFDDNVSGTPFLIQQDIDAQRHQEALAAIAQDSNIERFKAQFSATVDENTVKAL